MSVVKQVSTGLEYVFGEKADELAKETGFIKRVREVTGSWFAKTLVFGWLINPMATLEELTQTGASLGTSISPQALDQRFTEESGKFMKAMVDEAIKQTIASDAVAIPLLQRFKGVYLLDSTVITLPDELADIWEGCGGSGNASNSAVKVEVGLDALTGKLIGPFMENGRQQDRGSQLQWTELPEGALRLADLGYWGLDKLGELTEKKVHWLMRINSQVHLTDSEGQKWDIVDYAKKIEKNVDQIDEYVLLGARHRLLVRLIGHRVPTEIAAERKRKIRQTAKSNGKQPSQRLLTLAEWTFFVTDLSPEQLSVDESLVLARLRWQIELLFKLWKSHGHLDKSVSANESRILCEFYAKLLAMIVQHWLLLTSCWGFPDRSFFKAAKTVRQQAFSIMIAIGNSSALLQSLSRLQCTLQHGCRINKSRKTRRTFQLLLQFDATPS